MGRVFFFQISLFQLFAFSVLLLTADAREAHDRPSANRMVFLADQSIAENGTLRCENTAENTGAACRLLFQPHGKQRIYTVAGNTNSAMRLFIDGKREVAIEGDVRGQYLRVQSIKAL